MGDPQVIMAFEKWLWLKWVAPTSETSICQWCLLVVFHPMNIYRSIVSIILRCSKYHLVMCYIAIEMTIYNGFSHWKRWFSLVMLVYQRVSTINFHKTIVNPVKLKWTLHQQSSHFFANRGITLTILWDHLQWRGHALHFTKSVWKTWRKTWCIFSRCLNIPSISLSYLVGIPTPLKKWWSE